jgi:hypothetical protein
MFVTHHPFFQRQMCQKAKATSVTTAARTFHQVQARPLSHAHTGVGHAAMSRAFLPTVLLCLIAVLSRSTATSADTPDCPYPCLPPPTSGGATNSYPPPPPSTGAGGDFGSSYPPPPPGSYQLTPPGVMPGFSPPYSGLPSGPTPPPPNPVLPWFPWYYQHTNPITAATSSASSPDMDGKPRITVVGVLLLFLLGLF